MLKSNNLVAIFGYLTIKLYISEGKNPPKMVINSR